MLDNPETQNQEFDLENGNNKGPRTDQFYRTYGLPKRFMFPKMLRGYKEDLNKLPHPFYQSTSMEYGWYSPTVHTVPTAYFPRNYDFTRVAGRGGMYRNCSLNTEMDKSCV